MHFILFLFYVCECLRACMYVYLVPGAQGGQKRVLGPLALELWMVGSYHVGAEN